VRTVTRLRRTPAAAIVVVAALAVAYGVLIQPLGCNQTAHYALVQALGDGTPRIDRYAGETCDTAYVDGHFYAAKPPGLALLTLPAYLVLDAVGLVPENPARGSGFPDELIAMPRHAVWQLHLWGVVLPALALVALLWLVVGRATAILGGLGTLVLPFATDYFSHVPAAALGFAAYALLRHGRSPLLAGVVAGLAVVVDLPLGLVAVALALYARRASFVAGVAIGLVPLALYDWWAFGAPWRLPYSDAVLVPGESGHDVIGANDDGFFGIGLPSARVVLELLLSSKGLLVLSPLLAAAAYGLTRLPRRDAFLVGGTFAAFLVYNAGYYVPFGGFVAGPRFLIPTIPFLLVAVAAALRARPAPVLALALASVGAMVVATAAEPMLEGDDTGHWLYRWQHAIFAQSVVTFAGGPGGWPAVLPFLAAAGAALSFVRVQLSREGLPQAALAVGAWLLVLLAVPDLLRTDREQGEAWGALATVVVVAVVAWIVVRPRVAAAGILLLPVFAPEFHAHTKWTLLAGVAAAGAAAALELRRRRARPRL
jgi:hypothetical protein